MAALFFDIDGTILDRDQRCLESTVESLRRAKQKGHLLFINTGRTACDVPKEFEEIPFDGYCCGCGTYIKYRGQILFQSTIPPVRSSEIAVYMIKHGISGAIEGTEQIYFQREDYNKNADLVEYRKNIAQKNHGVVHTIEEPRIRYDKLMFCAEDAEDKEQFLKFLEPDIRAIDYGTGVYECIQKEYSKATAIQWLQEYLELDDEEIYVFGDGANDVDMFSYVKHTIAMGEHDKALDPMTEHVTDTVEKEGIRKALEHYKLI